MPPSHPLGAVFVTDENPEGKAAHTTITVFVTDLGIMVAACCPQSGTLSSFSALTLLVG